VAVAAVTIIAESSAPAQSQLQAQVCLQLEVTPLLKVSLQELFDTQEMAVASNDKGTSLL
jgi:hypothetical protein